MPVTVISESGEYVPAGHWFDEDERLGPQLMMVVSIVGGQGSGKSTLMNKLFGTEFKVAAKGAFGNAQTKGVTTAKAASNELVVALDVEGADARERGKSGKTFVTKCAGFASAISDVVIVNMWYHDLGRVDSASYTCLEAIFVESAKASLEGESIKSLIIFAVRDADEDASEADIKSRLVTDAQEAWERVNGPGSVDSVFDFDFMVLKHIRYNTSEFDTTVKEFQQRFLVESDPKYCFQTAYTKGIAAEGLAAYAQSLWDQTYGPPPISGTTREITVGSGNAVVKSDAAFSLALQTALDETAALSAKLDDGEKISSLGDVCKTLVSQCVQAYSDETADFEDDPSVMRKKQELETVLDSNLNTLFLKQLQVLREKALATFRSSLTSDSPNDFVFFQVDNFFVREAEDSIMPGSNWSYENERTFLHKLMEEISTQRKRLVDAQVNAAQETQQAFRYLQMQEGRIHQIQQQHYGGVSGAWNVGAAYRPPDSNVNISVGYQQGRTNIQISMVPDEQSSLLGPNGFTSGVGPANLGLSFNINV